MSLDWIQKASFSDRSVYSLLISWYPKTKSLEVNMSSVIEDMKSEDPEKKIGVLNNFSQIMNQIPAQQLSAYYQKAADDLDHRVRIAAAKQILLFPDFFQKFLADPDPEVRIVIIENSVEIRKVKEGILQTFDTLTKDSVADVRSALARVLHLHAKFSPNGQDPIQHFMTFFLPILKKLMADRNDDVRIEASKNVKYLTIQFGFDFTFDKLYPLLQLMLNDSQWRVRNNAAELICGLAMVCSSDFYDQNLSQFIFMFLKDNCNKVREFALSALPDIASQYGYEWVKTKLMDSLQELAQSPNFLYRETYLLCISQLAAFFPKQYLSNYVFQPMIRMLRDPVQNVVLLAIDLLSKHKDSIHPFRKQYELKPIIESLGENSPVTIKEKASQLISMI